jgi:hypothetical protein
MDKFLQMIREVKHEDAVMEPGREE